MPDKKGGLGGIFSGLKDELFEHDDSAAPKAAPAASTPPPPATQVFGAPPASAPAPVMSGTTPYTFGTTPLASAPEPLDDQALAAVNQGVFTAPSQYTTFMTMWEKLGKPADTSLVLNAMQVMDSSITAASILNAINDHLSKLDAVTASAANDFDNAARERLGGADAQLAALQKANDDAAAEITRHQKETAERITQISQMQTQRASDEAAITRAKARTEQAEAYVRQQLQTMQAKFSAA